MYFLSLASWAGQITQNTLFISSMDGKALSGAFWEASRCQGSGNISI